MCIVTLPIFRTIDLLYMFVLICMRHHFCHSVTPGERFIKLFKDWGRGRQFQMTCLGFRIKRSSYCCSLNQGPSVIQPTALPLSQAQLKTSLGISL